MNRKEILSVRLGTVYLVETKIFFIENVENRLKNKLNNTETHK